MHGFIISPLVPPLLFAVMLNFSYESLVTARPKTMQVQRRGGFGATQNNRYILVEYIHDVSWPSYAVDRCIDSSSPHYVQSFLFALMLKVSYESLVTARPKTMQVLSRLGFGPTQNDSNLLVEYIHDVSWPSYAVDRCMDSSSLHPFHCFCLPRCWKLAMSPWSLLDPKPC